MTSAIQLGFAEPYNLKENPSNTFENPNWEDWDGGKCGGQPVWLHPDLPKKPIECLKCQERMHFLCQLYCPRPNAFHRAIYVFVCPQVECRQARALKCQLDKDNEYYGCEDVVKQKHFPNLCALCHQVALHRCPKQQLYFCGRDHQMEYHKKIFRKNTFGTCNESRIKMDKGVDLSCIYDELEIVVEDEPPEDDDREKYTTVNEEEVDQMFTEDAEEDADLEQDDLNQMTGSKGIVEDEVTAHFYERINRNNGDVKNQCLRYFANWQNDIMNGFDKILWTSKNEMLVPEEKSYFQCNFCGAPRKFEFQILPQILHLMGSEKKKKGRRVCEEKKKVMLAAQELIDANKEEYEANKNLTDQHHKIISKAKEDTLKDDMSGIDFGTIVVFSCSSSCQDSSSAYMDEYAWVQPPI